MRTERWIKGAADLLYPRRCPFCDGILKRQEICVCRDCAAELQWISGPTCCICGKPVETDREEYCFDCRQRKHVFRQARAPFLYKGRIKESLMRFKYMGRAEYAKAYGKAMTEYGRQKAVFREVQLLVPVPVHRERRIERGYNQAELLAKQISGLTGIPVRGDLIIRKKKTRAQKTVGKESRSRNLYNAFSVPEKNRAVLEGKRILVIDDIFTTGSTADAVSLRLLEAGAVSVSVLCLAVSPGFS